jgi:hypothetical protein
MHAWPDVGRADHRTRLRDAPEKRLQQHCRAAAAALGFRPWHLSQARASQQSAGLPDDLLTGGPRLLAVEYKVRPNRQSPDQRAFQAAWAASGGGYLLVYSVADLVEALLRERTPAL